MTLSRPLRLTPRLVPKPWGGDRLRDLGRHVAAGDRVGESWEVADLSQEATDVADPVSRVASGPLTGQSLCELIAQDPAGLLGDARPGPGGRFPLLVKLLDARETLSVQVHPPLSLDTAAHKTETWVVLAVEPGAELLLGVAEGVTPEALQAVAGTGAMVELLRRLPVAVGDVVHVPAGTVHALGAGVLVAEVQTPSDVTYRLYDWADEQDRQRPLHVEQAMRAMRAAWEHNLSASLAAPGDGVLVDTDAYRLERVSLAAGEVLGASLLGGRPRVLLVIDGTLAWPADDEVGEVGEGDTDAADVEVGASGVRLLPAACTVPVRALCPATVLVATPA